MSVEPIKQTQTKPIYGEHGRTIYGEPVEPFMVSLSNQQSQFFWISAAKAYAEAARLLRHLISRNKVLSKVS